MTPRSSWIQGLGIGALVIALAALTALAVDYARLRHAHGETKQALQAARQTATDLDSRVASLTHMVSSQNDRMRTLASALKVSNTPETEEEPKPTFQPFSAKAFMGSEYLGEVLVGFRREISGHGEAAETTFHPIVRVPEAAKRALTVTTTNYIERPMATQPVSQQTSYHYYNQRDPYFWWSPVWTSNGPGVPSPPSPGMPSQPSAPQMAPSRLPAPSAAPRPQNLLIKANPRTIQLTTPTRVQP